jgi:uncharacterized glyoxalase superfamily protein PhnB
MSTATPQRPSFIPSLVYKDNRAALKWLREAFGFEVSEVLTDSKDNIVHAEMTFGDGVVMIGTEYFSWTKSPQAIGGTNTARVHVRVDKDIDGHYARAVAAGAKIEMKPADQFYGDRTYMAADLEGHHWTFFQAIKAVSFADMEKATGFKFKPLE